jgi:hypothetical protein
MFRRRIVVFRRPRLLGAALVGGLGFAVGRASKGSSTAAPTGQQADVPDLTGKLKDLADLHASGALTDDEFAAAKSRLIGS